MPNIFKISTRLGPEDRFTAHWDYLLHNNPEIGQKIVEYIASKTGLNNSVFVKGIDHPLFNGKDLPDFLIQCQDYNLICEHKLDSALGPKQLQRYCKLQPYNEKPNYVVLISNNARELIEPDVLALENYKRPNNSDCPYFLWEEFYPLVKQFSFPLATEFAEYMDSLGMTPWSLGDWGDIFKNETAAKSFTQLWRPIIQYFKAETDKAVCKVDPKNLGMQVRQPFKEIRVLYFAVDKSPNHFDHSFSGRGIYMCVVGLEGSGSLTSLPDIQIEIEGSLNTFSVRSPDKYKINSRGYVVMREYAISLEKILAPDITVAKERLLDFVKTCFIHLQQTITLG